MQSVDAQLAFVTFFALTWQQFFNYIRVDGPRRFQVSHLGQCQGAKRRTGQLKLRRSKPWNCMEIQPQHSRSGLKNFNGREKEKSRRIFRSIIDRRAGQGLGPAKSLILSIIMRSIIYDSILCSSGDHLVIILHSEKDHQKAQSEARGCCMGFCFVTAGSSHCSDARFGDLKVNRNHVLRAAKRPQLPTLR